MMLSRLTAGISMFLAIPFTLSGGMWQLNSLPAQAVQLTDGTVYFAEPPRLVNAVTTQKNTYVWGAIYYFTLTLPENAGEPLQRVEIAQGTGGDDIEYSVNDIVAFEGSQQHKGPRLTLGPVRTNRDSKTVSITFNPPVPPGKTVTIGLTPIHNPKFGGVYLFGVTAFPRGEKVHGQFLGFGRLHFYQNIGSFFNP